MLKENIYCEHNEPSTSIINQRFQRKEKFSCNNHVIYVNVLVRARIVEETKKAVSRHSQ